MYPLAMILAGSFFPLPLSEAELLLQQMDAKIIAAKTLRIEFEVKFPRRQGFTGNELPEATMAGRLMLGERNQFRCEFWYDTPNQFGVMMSDGKRIGVFGTDEPQFRTLPEWHNGVLRSWLGRGGTLMAMSQVESLSRKPSGEKPGLKDGPQVSNVRLLPDEKFNGVRCRVVGYDLSWPESFFQGCRVRVWLDSKTGLPVYREMFSEGNWGGTFTATHTRFDIDPKLDDKLFQFPTEAELLLAQMDANIRNAKTLRIEFTVDSPPGFLDLTKSGSKAVMRATGTLVLGEGNRFRYDFKREWPFQGPLVSDGLRLGGSWPGTPFERPEEPEKTPLPQWHNKVMREWLGRCGTLNSMLGMSLLLMKKPSERPGEADMPRVSNVKFAADEMMGYERIRVVEYDLTWKAFHTSDPVRFRVWINPITGLPIRRTMTDKRSGKPETFTAVHTKFEINPKLDDKLFELPK